MTFKLKASAAGIADFVGNTTNFLFPGAPAAVSVASFTPIQAPVGTTITLFGTGFLSGQTVKFFNNVTATVSAVISDTVATAVVPAGAATGAISVTNATGTAASSASFTVGALLAADSYATLPTRYPRFYNTPPSKASIPVGRVTRLTTSSTFADLQAAITAQSANLNTGTSFVLIPNGADITPPIGSSSINGPVFATAPAYPLVIAQTEWFDGGTVYSTGASLTKTQADAQPIIRPCRINSAAFYECDPWVRWTSRADLVMVGIRCHDDALGEGYTRSCVSIGDTSSAATVGDNVGHFAAWWCSSGLQHNGASKPFTAAGLWRYGIGRPYELNGSGVALRNCYHYGHGAPGSYGSDRGWMSGWTSAGPWYIKGNVVPNPGGIPFFHGGAYQYAGVNCEDVTIEQNYIYRTDPWNAENASARWLDGNGVACPYASKNIGEIKSGYRWLVQNNLFLNDFSVGQGSGLVFKASFQDSSGRSVGSNDFTFRFNVVTTWNKGAIGFSLCEGRGINIISPPDGTDAFQRISMHDNVFAVVAGKPSVSGSPTSARPRLVYVTRQAGYDGTDIRATRAPEQIDISNNLFWGYSSEGPDIPGLLVDGVNPALTLSQLRWKHNIMGAANVTGGASPILYGYTHANSNATGDTAYGMAQFVGGNFPSVDIGINAHVNFEPLYGLGSTTGVVGQVSYATAAAAGLVVTALDQYAYAGGAALLTAGAGGVRIGPDLSACMASRSAILAGTIT